MDDRCTWKDCNQIGVHCQTARDGSVWSILCEKHHLELDESITSLDPKTILRAWVLAQGGAKKAATRMTEPR